MKSTLPLSLVLVAALAEPGAADTSAKPTATPHCVQPSNKITAEERDAKRFNAQAIDNGLAAMQLKRAPLERGDLGHVQYAADGTYSNGEHRYVGIAHPRRATSPESVVFATDASGAIVQVEVTFIEVAPAKSYLLCACGPIAGLYDQAAELPAGAVYKGVISMSAQHREVSVTVTNIKRNGNPCMPAPVLRMFPLD
jgi:hypothetical protein